MAESKISFISKKLKVDSDYRTEVRYWNKELIR